MVEKSGKILYNKTINKEKEQGVWIWKFYTQ